MTQAEGNSYHGNPNLKPLAYQHDFSQEEIEEYIKYGLITIVTLAFIAVAIGITFKFFVSVNNRVFAHTIEYDDGSCMVYDYKYFLICMNEGRDYADTEIYLDYKKQKEEWIESID